MSVPRIEIPFVCDQRGDCCREQPYIVVSVAEADLLASHTPVGSSFVLAPHDESGFHRLIGKPCPFLRGNLCAVYEIRPYNCRRFICGRPSGWPEPYMQRASGECLNFTTRLKDVRFFRHAREVQAAAQPWALAHGWSP